MLWMLSAADPKRAQMIKLSAATHKLDNAVIVFKKKIISSFNKINICEKYIKSSKGLSKESDDFVNQNK
jgi:hypothetical protein